MRLRTWGRAGWWPFDRLRVVSKVEPQALTVKVGTVGVDRAVALMELVQTFG